MLHQTTATVLPGAEMPEEAVTRPLRLAVYGFIGREGGGFSAANSVVLDRLLRLGHRIDLYANAGFVHPHELEVHANYRYEPVTLGTIDRGWDLVLHRLPAALRDLVRIPYGELANAAYERAIARRIRDRHAQEPYDALLFLGLLPSFRIRGLPIIGWPQGSPLGEWEAIRRLRSLILRYGGWRVYGALNLFYLYRTLLGRHRLGFCDALICGSRWSVGMWRREGVPAEAIHALPYPIDLERFTPEGPGARTPGVTTFLWLGRIVPRKRFDLLLDAYRLVRRERTDVRLRIFGSIAYPRGYQTLIEGIGPEEGIAYQPTIATEQVPELLRSVDVLVQPSENENLGSSVTEALSCGTPVIVGPTNGTRDYISPSSLVLEAYTPEALKRAMLCMIDRLRSDADRIRAEARATAEEQVAPAVVACRLCALLAEVRARAQRRGVRH